MDTFTTSSKSLSISALVIRFWRVQCTIQVTQGKFAAGPLSIRKVRSINACWVFDRGTWIHPANLQKNLPKVTSELANAEMVKIAMILWKPSVQRPEVLHNYLCLTRCTTWQHQFGSCSAFWLLSSFDGLDVCSNLSQGLVNPLPWKR